jgi:hypothetical protein
MSWKIYFLHSHLSFFPETQKLLVMNKGNGFTPGYSQNGVISTKLLSGYDGGSLLVSAQR